ncbi:toxin-antitoxin system YwqK family antitoxin [Vibrio sp. C8]
MRLISLIIFALSFSPFAYSKVVWLDEQWKETSKDGASFYIEVPLARDGKAWIAEVYYKENGQLRFKTNITKDSIFDPESKVIGDHYYYFKNGDIQSKGSLDESGQGNGEVISYFENTPNKISSITYFRNGVKHGREQNFYREGGLSKESEYRNGKLHGLQKYYSPKGVLYTESTYENGLLHGPQKIWSEEDSTLILVEHYQSGKKHGEQISYFADGMIQESEFYSQGTLIGVRESYYSDGRLKERERFDENGRRMERTNFYDRSAERLEQIWSYTDRGITEDKRLYQNEQLLRHERMFTGKRAPLGQVIKEEFDPQGTLIARKETRNGKLYGEHVWYEKSSIKYRILNTSYYVDGLQHGRYLSKAQDGSILEQGQYSMGKKVGPWLYRSPVSERTVIYDKNGKKHGEEREKALDGTIISQATYHHGQLDGLYERYDNDRTLLESGIYKLGVKNGQWLEDEGSGYGNYYASKGEYRQGNRVGLWISTTKSGYEIDRSNYNDKGQLHGFRYHMERNGSGALTKVEHYMNGLTVGKQFQYRNGKPEKVTLYDENGQKQKVIFQDPEVKEVFDLESLLFH